MEAYAPACHIDGMVPIRPNAASTSGQLVFIISYAVRAGGAPIRSRSSPSPIPEGPKISSEWKPFSTRKCRRWARFRPTASKPSICSPGNIRRGGTARDARRAALIVGPGESFSCCRPVAILTLRDPRAPPTSRARLVAKHGEFRMQVRFLAWQEREPSFSASHGR